MTRRHRSSHPQRNGRPPLPQVEPAEAAAPPPAAPEVLPAIEAIHEPQPAPISPYRFYHIAIAFAFALTIGFVLGASVMMLISSPGRSPVTATTPSFNVSDPVPKLLDSVNTPQEHVGNLENTTGNSTSDNPDQKTEASKKNKPERYAITTAVITVTLLLATMKTFTRATQEANGLIGSSLAACICAAFSLVFLLSSVACENSGWPFMGAISELLFKLFVVAYFFFLVITEYLIAEHPLEVVCNITAALFCGLAFSLAALTPYYVGTQFYQYFPKLEYGFGIFALLVSGIAKCTGIIRR